MSAVEGRVVGVVLAAGTGSRFGDENKLLAELDGDPLVRHAAETLLAAGLDAVCVVVGHEADSVPDAVADLSVETVDNPAYESGQASSVVAGIQWAREHGAAYAVVALGDMPWVSPSTVETLVAAATVSDAEVAVPTYEDQRGNPVVFHRDAFERLDELTGDAGARQCFEALAVERVPVADPGVHADVDTRSALTDVGGDECLSTLADVDDDE